MRTGVLIVLLLCLGSAWAITEAEFMAELNAYAGQTEFFCWKHSYGRGVGKIPQGCPPGKRKDPILCYEPCKEGYRAVLNRCWKGLLNSYGRGIGVPATHCDAGWENKAGLCYPNCKSGYNGVGPVCWKNCEGKTPVNCGACCGSSAAVCAKNIVNIIKSVLEMIVNIAKAILTSGASLIQKAAENFSKPETYKAAFEVAREFHNKHFSEEAFVRFMTATGQRVKQVVNGDLIRNIYRSAKGNDWGRLVTEMASKFDPIGVAKVIHSLIHDVC